MLTTQYRHTANASATNPMTTELSAELSHALSAAGVDLDAVSVESDDAITIIAGATRIAIGEEEGWLTALGADEEGEWMIYEGESIADLAAAVATVK